MADIAHISSFLTTVEGPRQTQGYIPCNLKAGGTANYRGGPFPERYAAMGASGVTIGTGCDLGQTDADTLRAYGLDDQCLLDCFAPYLGLKQDAAIMRLHEKPLSITPAQAEKLDHAVHGGYLARYVRPAYDRASAVPFDALPPQAQAVVMSVCFQKGCGGVRRDWPKLWSYLTAQNWASAANELQTGFRQYQNRRMAEGKHLSTLLEKGRHV